MATPLEPQSSTVSLADALAQVLGASQARQPHLAARLERAAQLVQAGAVTPRGTAPGAYWVQSQTDPECYYAIDLTTEYCECQDQRGRGQVCQHLLAVHLLRAAHQRRGQLQRALDYGLLDRFALTPQGEAYLAGLRDGQAAPPYAVA